MSNVTFRFIKSDLTQVSSQFSFQPINNYPVLVGSSLANADEITSSYSPATLSIPDNLYQVETFGNDWYISASNNVYTLISGSVISASVCTVNFSVLNNDNTPSNGSLISISPINDNVIYTNAGTSSFVLGDEINNYTDANGGLVVSLLSQLYQVTLKGKYRDTIFTMLPSGSNGNVKDFIC